MRWLISAQTWGGGLLVDGGIIPSFFVRGKEESFWNLSSDEFRRLQGEIGVSWIGSWSGGEIVENRRLRGDLDFIWCILGTDVVVSGRAVERLPLRGESSSFIGRIGSIFGRDVTTECLVGDNTIECRLRLRKKSSFVGVASTFGKEAATEDFVGNDMIDRPRRSSQSSRREEL